MLRVLHPREYLRKTAYSQPKQVACLSIDSARTATYNSQNLKTLPPISTIALPIDLEQGFSAYKDSDKQHKERLELLLQAISHHRIPLAHIVTWRGVITKIMTSIYKSEPFTIHATRHSGAIFLDLVKTFYGPMDRFSYFGHKFESTLLDPGSKVDPNVQFCSVFTANIGGHSLLLGGEVDCLIRVSEKDEYCELKTHKTLTPSNTTAFIRHKLLATWAQSFLAGVENVVFGFREDNQVKSLKQYKTNEFPRMARERQLWDPNACLTFLDVFLDFVKKQVLIDDANVVYTFTFDARKKEVAVSGPVTGGKNVFVFTEMLDGIESRNDVAGDKLKRQHSTADSQASFDSGVKTNKFPRD